MKKQNVLYFLEAALAENLAEEQFAIDWNSKNHQIEILVRLFAENKTGSTILDCADIASEEEIIEFEDGLLFYEEKGTDFVPDEYLVTLPFNRKKGIQKAELRSVAAYLKEVLDEGVGDLLDFLNDDEKEVFSLVWDEVRYAVYREKEFAKVDGAEFVPYPSF